MSFFPSPLLSARLGSCVLNTESPNVCILLILLCLAFPRLSTVFASRCGKHNTAMIAHAFQKAPNTAEEPETFILSPSQSPPSPRSLSSASVGPLPHFQPRYSAPMIANTHNDSISRGPAEVPH